MLRYVTNPACSAHWQTQQRVACSTPDPPPYQRQTQEILARRQKYSELVRIPEISADGALDARRCSGTIVAPMAMMAMAGRTKLKAIIAVTSLATLVTKMMIAMATSMTSSTHQVVESQKYKFSSQCSLASAFLGGLKNVKAPGGGEWMSGGSTASRRGGG